MYLDDADAISNMEASKFPKFEELPGPGQHDFLLLVANGEYLEPMTVDLFVNDERSERQIWRTKLLPRGFATFETKPTPERQLESACLALVRVNGRRISVRIVVHEGESATKDFVLEDVERESIGALCTYKETRFVQNKKPK